MKIPATPYTWPHDAAAAGGATALIIIDMQNDFLSPSGYISHHLPPSDITTLPRLRSTITPIKSLLILFRTLGWPIIFTREGHPPDLSTVTSRELFRSRNNDTGLGIGDVGPLGRLLVRGEVGHGIIPELEPIILQSVEGREGGKEKGKGKGEGEIVIDKPGRGAFTRTDLGKELQERDVKRLVVVGVTTDCCVSSTVREADDRGFEVLVVREGCAAVEERLGDAALESLVGEGGLMACVAGVEDVKAVLEGMVVVVTSREKEKELRN